LSEMAGVYIDPLFRSASTWNFPLISRKFHVDADQVRQKSNPTTIICCFSATAWNFSETFYTYRHLSAKRHL